MIELLESIEEGLAVLIAGVLLVIAIPVFGICWGLRVVISRWEERRT